MSDHFMIPIVPGEIEIITSNDKLYQEYTTILVLLHDLVSRYGLEDPHFQMTEAQIQKRLKASLKRMKKQRVSAELVSAIESNIEHATSFSKRPERAVDADKFAKELLNEYANLRRSRYGAG